MIRPPQDLLTFPDLKGVEEMALDMMTMMMILGVWVRMMKMIFGDKVDFSYYFFVTRCLFYSHALLDWYFYKKSLTYKASWGNEKVNKVYF